MPEKLNPICCCHYGCIKSMICSPDTTVFYYHMAPLTDMMRLHHTNDGNDPTTKSNDRLFQGFPIILNTRPQEFSAHFAPYIIFISAWCGLWCDQWDVNLSSIATLLCSCVCVCVCLDKLLRVKTWDSVKCYYKDWYTANVGVCRSGRLKTQFSHFWSWVGEYANILDVEKTQKVASW